MSEQTVCSALSGSAVISSTSQTTVLSPGVRVTRPGWAQRAQGPGRGGCASRFCPQSSISFCCFRDKPANHTPSSCSQGACVQAQPGEACAALPSASRVPEGSLTLAAGARVTQGRDPDGDGVFVHKACCRLSLGGPEFSASSLTKRAPSPPFESWRLLTSAFHIKVSNCASAHLTATLCVRTCPPSLRRNVVGACCPPSNSLLPEPGGGWEVGRRLALFLVSASTNMH